MLWLQVLEELGLDEVDMLDDEGIDMDMDTVEGEYSSLLSIALHYILFLFQKIHRLLMLPAGIGLLQIVVASFLPQMLDSRVSQTLDSMISRILGRAVFLTLMSHLNTMTH